MKLIIIFLSLLAIGCSFEQNKQGERIFYLSEKNDICFPDSWVGSYGSFTVSSVSGEQEPIEVVHFWSQGEPFLIAKGGCINLWDGPNNSKMIMKRSKLMNGNYIVNVRIGEFGHSAKLTISPEQRQ